MQATGSARGKVILFGEHAVVYGVPALVAGLERGAQAFVELSAESEILWDRELLPTDDPLYRALSETRRILGAPPVRLRLELAIPSGAGLGASAALGVATARALTALVGAGNEPSLGGAVSAWESVFHGSPSGVDAAAAELGGVLRFVKGETPTPLRLPEPLEICVCLAGPPASTKEMVEQVRRHKESDNARFQRTLASIAKLVDEGIEALGKSDSKRLGALLTQNHELLTEWELSTPELERARSLALEAGAFGAKLTGSGGGGALIALGPPGPLLSTWKTHGFDCFCSSIGGSPNHD